MQINISEPCIGKEELSAVKIPLKTGWVSQGPIVKKFEDEFAKKHNVKYAFAVSSGTTALHTALLALEIGPGDEVIVPSFTWVASANAVLYCGATPVLVDIELNSFNLDPTRLAKAITKKTKAIIAIHLFGQSADIDKIKEIAPDIAIVEDAACAAGGRYKGENIGSIGDVACFSFHPRKIITTGEGGMITTNNNDIGKKITSLRNHGLSYSSHQIGSPEYMGEVLMLGYNFRMTDIQAAIGIEQLKKLENFIAHRTTLVNYYYEFLRDLKWLEMPQAAGDVLHSWQAFVCLVNTDKSPISRNELMRILSKNNISTRPGTHAIHTLDYYKQRFGYSENQFPNALLAQNCSIALPLHNNLRKKDIEVISSTIKSIS
ncbi:DegT/DnrJ/EryC1/StrS family aminotransferase [Candidatus Dojkabacteria bacterium]|uniref:DegT/DnrJ/EryC1/StrS family aminotransferase n=1 Tax=Candidatus Dojkabacteria bacterium TaxID=2099670 RepID=A0A955L7U9_9BACT|nr:DegT/DnrJ/EryC1/StrS family aminotransferase [Candidatus Dojkabacteria bacterium]